MIKMRDKYHEPVLVKEILSNLGLDAPLKTKVRIIDATLGTGGQTQVMVKANAEVLGIEADPEMLKIAEDRLNKDNLRPCRLVLGNFKDIDIIAQKEGFSKVDGVLFDLGITNLQLMSGERGFSFSNCEAALDMRIDTGNQTVTGADLLNVLREDQLIDLFKAVLDISSARWLAKRVIEKRTKEPIRTAGHFLDICQNLKGKPALNPATLPFLALRMAVNCELENLALALPKAFGLLKKGGKILVITFHSGEEKVVRDFSKNFVGPIKPEIKEISSNPRSRSAELFVFKK